MKKRRNIRQKAIKLAAVTFLCACSTTILSGCSIGKKELVFTTGLASWELFKMDNQSCSVSDGKVYLMNYQNIYGNAYGVDLWKNDACKDKLETYVKNLAVTELAQVTCMNLLAKKQNLELSDEENSKVAKAAAEYYDSLTKEERNYSGASKHSIEELYRSYALAKKAYHSLTDSVNEEVSDSEARVMKVQIICVKKRALSDEITQKLSAGNDFAGIASNYNSAGDIEQTVKRGDLPKEVEDVAFSLDDGEVSEMIKTEKGYYFVKCINKFEEELTDQNKKKIVADREKEAFQKEYSELMKGLHSTMNEDAWADTKIELSDQIQTKSLFSIYSKYFSE